MKNLLFWLTLLLIVIAVIFGGQALVYIGEFIKMIGKFITVVTF